MGTRTGDRSRTGPPIDVRPVMAEQHELFLDLLRGLAAGDWRQPTACPGWSVHDVAVHVLGDHAGRLSIHRDAWQALAPRDGEAFSRFLDRINDEWVVAGRRLAPPLHVDQLAHLGGQVTEHWRRLPPDTPSWPVSWAGPDPAPAWLDCARDFTEYWTHHQQIAGALGRPGPDEPRFAVPVIDTFLRALPHTLREVPAAPGTAVRVEVTGNGAGRWTALREADGWVLDDPSAAGEPAAAVRLDTTTAWRLCTRGLLPEQVTAEVSGDPDLAAAALRIVSIVRTEPAEVNPELTDSA
jgi:uncharacterized protein (TIGR03083 family)